MDSTLQTPIQKNFKFKFKRKATKRFPIKRKKSNHFQLFVNFCRLHQITFFQFYDSNNWIGPAIKVAQPQIEHVYSLLESQPFDTISLGGLGFAIIRPSQHLQDNTIYSQSNYELLSFTHTPIIPYTSDNESNDDDDYSANDHDDYSVNDDDDYSANDHDDYSANDHDDYSHESVNDDDDYSHESVNDDDDYSTNDHDDISLDTQFIAEEWTYNTTTFLLDTTTNYLYCPNSLQYLGKKRGEFSIDYYHKE